MYDSFIKPLAKDTFNFVLDILFPISCLSCGIEGSFICEACRPQLTQIENQQCIACKKPSPFGLTHPGCSTPHGADGLVSIFNYRDEKVADALIKGKYYFLKNIYPILAILAAKKIQVDFPKLLEPGTLNLKPVFVPIPLAPRRKRWRGFNQAELLCNILSEELRTPVENALVRVRYTKTQKDLKREQRIKNMEGCFKISKEAAIRGKNIVLVDDVVTTGSTLLEAAKVLKRNGADKVWCLTIARD